MHIFIFKFVFKLEFKIIAELDQITVSLSSSVSAISLKQESSIVPSGLLVVEQYTWKSLVTGQPVLRIKTTGSILHCLFLEIKLLSLS